jgi:8-oxo-dGTP pyrophosphatase MutT (NUDIX family)
MKYGTMTYVERGDGGVLMLKKNERVDDPNSGFYTLPGGKLEKNELGVRGRLESVIREVKEETGLILGDINLK